MEKQQKIEIKLNENHDLKSASNRERPNEVVAFVKSTFSSLNDRLNPSFRHRST